jgi:hypothetical protein
VVGGWWLVVGGWLLAVGGWQIQLKEPKKLLIFGPFTNFQGFGA